MRKYAPTKPSVKIDILFEATRIETLCMIGYLHLTNLADNSVGKLRNGKATKIQKWVSNSEMIVKVSMCDVRDINHVNMGTN